MTTIKITQNYRIARTKGNNKGNNTGNNKGLKPGNKTGNKKGSRGNPRKPYFYILGWAVRSRLFDDGSNSS